MTIEQKSRPPRARGLKPEISETNEAGTVAPPAGAWIETGYTELDDGGHRRAPRGRVD